MRHGIYEVKPILKKNKDKSVDTSNSLLFALYSSVKIRHKQESLRDKGHGFLKDKCIIIYGSDLKIQYFLEFVQKNIMKL